jgi:lysophospholipid acyltransferase (LPLAT)-like uncharacterized protein
MSRKRKSLLKGRWGPLILRFERYLGAAVIYLLGSTWRITETGAHPGEHVLYIPWHCHLVCILYHMRFRNVGVLVSTSRDGELGAGPAAILGFTPIRGSSSKGGSEAAREMIEHARRFSIGVIPDGPKGPPRVLKPGVTRIAYQSRLPMRPMAVLADRVWTLPTWDRMIIPKPFARVEFRFGDPIPVTLKDKLESAAARLQTALDELNHP